MWSSSSSGSFNSGRPDNVKDRKEYLYLSS
jgi:hypothetical protein